MLPMAISCSALIQARLLHTALDFRRRSHKTKWYSKVSLGGTVMVYKSNGKNRKTTKPRFPFTAHEKTLAKSPCNKPGLLAPTHHTTAAPTQSLSVPSIIPISRHQHRNCETSTPCRGASFTVATVSRVHDDASSLLLTAIHTLQQRSIVVEITLGVCSESFKRDRQWHLAIPHAN